MGAKNKPVQIPMTDEMIAKVDTMLDVAEKALLALEIAEFTTLENQSEVKNYTIEIAEQFKINHKEIDEEIQKYSNGWDISRLVKIDKDILRIAITELLYTKGAPLKVVVDEACVVLFVTTRHNMRTDNEFLAFVNLFVGIEILGNVCLCDDLSFWVLFVESILT